MAWKLCKRVAIFYQTPTCWLSLQAGHGAAAAVAPPTRLVAALWNMLSRAI